MLLLIIGSREKFSWDTRVPHLNAELVKEEVDEEHDALWDVVIRVGAPCRGKHNSESGFGDAFPKAAEPLPVPDHCVHGEHHYQQDIALVKR